MTKQSVSNGKKGHLRNAFTLAVGGVAVTVVAIFGGAGITNGTPDQVNTPPDKGIAIGPTEPDIINAFGQSAPRTTVAQDPYRRQWDDMLKRQRNDLRNPAKAQAYARFLTQFDPLKGQSLVQEAEGVNKIVNEETAYRTDQDQYNKPDYWAAPVETVLNQKGDCEDYAILEKAALRYIGVPESRMFLTLVNDNGNALDGVNHAILLLNEAPDGAPPDFFVLSDAQPVLPANNDVISNRWVMDSGWRADFILMDVRNDDGYWKVPDQNNSYASAKPVIRIAAQRGPKMG